jgi:hypothetical protein
MMLRMVGYQLLVIGYWGRAGSERGGNKNEHGLGEMNS